MANTWGKAKGISPRLHRWLEVTVCTPASRISESEMQMQPGGCLHGTHLCFQTLPWDILMVLLLQEKDTCNKARIWVSTAGSAGVTCDRVAWRSQTHIRLFKHRACLSLCLQHQGQISSDPGHHWHRFFQMSAQTHRWCWDYWHHQYLSSS